MRKTAQIVIGLVISLLALALAFRGANVTLMGQALREANYWFLIPSVILTWLGLYARAASWRVILDRRVPYHRVFDAMNEGYLLNNFLPLRLGEVGRAYLISRAGQVTAYQALSSVLVERIIDLIMAVSLLLAFLPFATGLPLAWQVAATSLALGAVGLVGLIIVVRRRVAIVQWARRVLDRLNWRWLHPARMEARLASFLAGLAVLQDPRRAVAAAFWSTIAWVAAAFSTWFLLLAFVPTASIPMAFIVLTVVALGGAVPSLPGGVGLFEAFVVGILAVFAVENSRALSFGLIFHAQQLVLTTVLGSLALGREGETISHLARSAQALLNRADKNPPPPPTVPEPAAPEPASSNQ